MTDLELTVVQAKLLARELRKRLAAEGVIVSHSAALEKVAKQHGFRDWNTLVASIGDRPPYGWHPGGRVAGQYLSQPFRATIKSAQRVRPGWYRLDLELDEAIDVVKFDSFSGLRKRIRAVVGPVGASREKTSDGVPHMKLYQ